MAKKLNRRPLHMLVHDADTWLEYREKNLLQLRRTWEKTHPPIRPGRRSVRPLEAMSVLTAGLGLARMEFHGFGGAPVTLAGTDLFPHIPKVAKPLTRGKLLRLLEEHGPDLKGKNKASLRREYLSFFIVAFMYPIMASAIHEKTGLGVIPRATEWNYLRRKVPKAYRAAIKTFRELDPTFSPPTR